MMTLPKFDTPFPPAEDLLAEQHRLHTQADSMLGATGIMHLLGTAGPVGPVGGSYDYGLMAYPDLDLEIISSSVDKHIFAGLVAKLVNTDYVRKLSTANTVDFPPLHPGRPAGYWIGLEIPYEDDRWGIDCWLQKPEWVGNAPDQYGERLKNISQNQVVAILAIKHYLIYKGFYGTSFYSVNVYDEVLDHGVLSAGEFAQKHGLD